MAKDHGSNVKDDKQYEGLRDKGMSKSRAARIANTSQTSSKVGSASGDGKKKRSSSSQGGTQAQKAAAGRKGARKSN